MSSRRQFISLLGGAAVVWPLAARAQQAGVPLVGLLVSTQIDDRQIAAIRQGLKDAGYIEGRNVAIKYRSGDGRFDRLPAMAAELAADAPAAIIALAPALRWPRKLQRRPFRSCSRLAETRSNSVSFPALTDRAAMLRA